MLGPLNKEKFRVDIYQMITQSFARFFYSGDHIESFRDFLSLKI